MTLNQFLLTVFVGWGMFLLSAWMFRKREPVATPEVQKLPPIDVQVLQANTISENDVLIFLVNSDNPMSETELTALKVATEEFLTAHGIPNEVLYLNNCEFRLARTRIV